MGAFDMKRFHVTVREVFQQDVVVEACDKYAAIDKAISKVEDGPDWDSSYWDADIDHVYEIDEELAP
jgi:hypothetical protein